MRNCFFLVTMAVLISCAGREQYAGDDIITWQFEKICLWGDDRPPTAPNAYYAIVFRDLNGGKVTKTYFVTYERLQPLLAYFGVPGPEQLEGKGFQSVSPYPDMALDRFIAQVTAPPKRAAPSDEEIYEAVAAALAQMKAPDLSGVDAPRVFGKLFEHGKLRQEWLEWFQNHIQTLSHGRVKLARVDSKNFTHTFRCCVEYLELRRGKDTRRLIFMPEYLLFDDDED